MVGCGFVKTEHYSKTMYLYWQKKDQLAGLASKHKIGQRHIASFLAERPARIGFGVIWVHGKS
jgi:hypothetical protein